jgi:cyclopropane-fatty-acyl-phospholipid synthase
MSQKQVKNIVNSLLQKSGIQINGPHPWDIQIHDERLYQRVLTDRSLGLGESYMDGWWDTPALDQFIFRLLRADIDKIVRGSSALILSGLMARVFNLQSKQRSFQVGEQHYDKGNDLYQKMLDSRLTYTCGYWKHAANLEEAQEAKLELVCQKLQLQSGQRILDIGCGWGSFMKYAAEKYGVSCVGITVSKEQMELGKQMCKGLPIEFRLQDYREVYEQFDGVVSLGMFEHVGYKNYRTFMQVVERCLKDDGLFLLHSFGQSVSTHAPDPWFHKYIFPNGMAPSIAQLGAAFEKLFVMEDWHNFGADYDPTLMAWFKNFDEHWAELSDKYDQRFYRMWKYYLLSLAGTFRARGFQLWQIVLSKRGLVGGYNSVRF